jgi:hypothetical protein
MLRAINVGPETFDRPIEDVAVGGDSDRTLTMAY